MLEVKKITVPSPVQFNMVIFGMRNAFKSHKRGDSGIDWEYKLQENDPLVCERCTYSLKYNNSCSDAFIDAGFVLGENDKKLLLNLTKLGTSDRKVLRQLPIILEVKAPLCWWKQADKYQVGTVTNSESTMHTLMNKPFEVSDFSTDNWEDNFVFYGKPDPIIMPDGSEEECQYSTTIPEDFLEDFVSYLNNLRDAYLETKKKGLWNAINGLLPQSYLQTRTWSLNYEVALQIIRQRTNHPLEEWKTLIDYLLRNVPYLEDIYKASCAKEDKLKTLEQENKTLMQEIKKLKDRLKEKQ